jgi:DNA-binding beta-propeller fold protein YncE
MMSGRAHGLFACISVLALCGAPRALAASPFDYADGFARPLALAVEPTSGWLLVALSTADSVIAVDPVTHKVRARLSVCAYPQSLATTPAGVVVSCRFSTELGLIERAAQGLRYRPLLTLPQHGRRGIASSEDGRTLYVASPPARGVDVVRPESGTVQQVATGISPRRVAIVRDPRAPSQRLLLVDNYVSHTVTVQRLLPTGLVGELLQTIVTEAPVQDLAVIPGRGLYLLTHEDRPLDRADGPVHWLDSVVLMLPPGSSTPFADAGLGHRRAFNLTERQGLAQLDAIALAPDGRIAIVGSATDNVLLLQAADELDGGRVLVVGAHPSAALFLPDGQLVTADRLSDSLSFIDAATNKVDTVALDAAPRREPWALGELLFYSRALVPNNRADGPLSIYACSACHDEGHVDGRRHPAKHNRFQSMTKTCRGLAHTAPYLSLGMLDSLSDFADNIVATHAQGDDHYATSLRVLRGGAWKNVTLGPDELRRAMAAYLARIPLERSPFSDGRTLSDDARRGMALFLEECTRCHLATEDTHDARRPHDLERAILDGRLVFTSKSRFDVGTPVLGEGGNNPPSLRGTWDAAPYLSDGSAETLELLMERTDPSTERVHAASNAKQPHFGARERAWLVAFLRSL